MDEPLGDLELLNQIDDAEQTTDLSSELEETPEEEQGVESDSEPEEQQADAADEEKVEEVAEEEPESDEAEKLAQGRLTFKEITAKFPTLFKEFPQLRHTFFREQEYSNVFPTVEDAKEANQKAQNYSYLEQDILAGNPGNLLVSVAQSDPAAFAKVVNNFLPTVYSLSKDTFYEVTQPILVNALQAAYKDGTETGNKNLATAAQYINRFLFGTADIDQTRPIVNRQAPPPDPERQQFEQEKGRFIQGRTREFEADVHKSAEAEIRKLSAAGLDPENQLNEFTRNSIIDKVVAQVGAVLLKDTKHLAMMNSLWKRAFQSGLTPEYKTRILQAFLSRAKEVLPTIRTKVRSEAIGTAKAKAPIKRVTGAGTSSKPLGQVNPRKVDWNKTSDLDILNGNIKMRN